MPSLQNNKPSFVTCDTYNPTVKEQQPIGTQVLRVVATDPDKWQTIEYSLLLDFTEHIRFQIDKKTGDVTTTHVFDYDYPMNEKIIYVTVLAMDDGSPRLYDMCTFKVTVLDINDNAPIFDKARYEETVFKDSEINKYVATISAMDMDESENGIVKYEILETMSDFAYFGINENNGIIRITKQIDRNPGDYYTIRVRAYNEDMDNGILQEAEIDVEFRVVERNDLRPYFTLLQQIPIVLHESYDEYFVPLVKMNVNSNIQNNPNVFCTLTKGHTEQTNSQSTFKLEQNNTTVLIMLNKPLDFETAAEYSLQVVAKNAYYMETALVIKIVVLDDNDNAPEFDGNKSGAIPEHEPPGTLVLQVHAKDHDGTPANNIVSYRIEPRHHAFQIDHQTGIITSLVEFDRESKDVYILQVIAEDNSPSIWFRNGKPNRASQMITIQITDKNDHQPLFRQKYYLVEDVLEDQKTDTFVLKVEADDQDTSSVIKYSILSGNVDDAFKINATNGQILVNNLLDYEMIREYTLVVQADDGIFQDNTTVCIKITNVNDNPPRFIDMHILKIQEESIPTDCIMNLQAYDPDIDDRTENQHIRFNVAEMHEDFLSIDDDGCLRLRKALDRDPPQGKQMWQFIIIATDEEGDGMKTSAMVNIILEDINDNAPQLSNIMPVIWNENQPPGIITTLMAIDLDETQHGLPFVYSIESNASEEIKNKFLVKDDKLYALVSFDREHQKEFHVPIRIQDSSEKPVSSINILRVIIGDKNDNKMISSESYTTVYNYKRMLPKTEIGRVYVEDPDDWDIAEKLFEWDLNIAQPSKIHFDLNHVSGAITISAGTPSGIYELYFIVFEHSRYFERHNVSTRMIVTVKDIWEEDVDRSGSIRFLNVTDEQFLTKTADQLSSPKDRLVSSIANVFNISKEYVDVFTVLMDKHENDTVLDVRYLVQNSSYTADFLNVMLSYQVHQLEDDVGVPVVTVGIDECVLKGCSCKGSCKNNIYKSNYPITISTNTISFVGVNAFVQADCMYRANITPIVDIHLEDDGYALLPSISSSGITRITMELSAKADDGLVLYIGPLYYDKHKSERNFVALQLFEGHPALMPYVQFVGERLVAKPYLRKNISPQSHPM
ncbi:DE-cadherin-like [Anopheles funestus]|uniref:DE-cadherin-like n=1 Tax=Anopheles funestus TaxID=62324 RepID=UPI0020C6ED00|nr:DE-cadherin-like [Anopheles funestus]